MMNSYNIHVEPPSSQRLNWVFDCNFAAVLPCLAREGAILTLLTYMAVWLSSWKAEVAKVVINEGSTPLSTSSITLAANQLTKSKSQLSHIRSEINSPWYIMNKT